MSVTFTTVGLNITSEKRLVCFYESIKIPKYNNMKNKFGFMRLNCIYTLA